MKPDIHFSGGDRCWHRVELREECKAWGRLGWERLHRVQHMSGRWWGREGRVFSSAGGKHKASEPQGVGPQGFPMSLEKGSLQSTGVAS